MALYYDLPVFKDVYQMTLRIFQVTTNFPREYKFTLGQDLKRDCILLVRYIYRANKTKDKTVYLEQFLDSFEVVKLELRLCKDLHLTTVKQQAEFSVFMDSIGKQITAWRNAGSIFVKYQKIINIVMAVLLMLCAVSLAVVPFKKKHLNSLRQSTTKLTRL